MNKPGTADDVTFWNAADINWKSGLVDTGPDLGTHRYGSGSGSSSGLYFFSITMVTGVWDAKEQTETTQTARGD